MIGMLVCAVVALIYLVKGVFRLFTDKYKGALIAFFAFVCWGGAAFLGAAAISASVHP